MPIIEFVYSILGSISRACSWWFMNLCSTHRSFSAAEVTHDLAKFKAGCDALVANRWSDDLPGVADKVHTRDLFKRD